MTALEYWAGASWIFDPWRERGHENFTLEPKREMRCSMVSCQVYLIPQNCWFIRLISQSETLLNHQGLILFPRAISTVGVILGVNIWLQLGWRPPCEVSKNLVVPVALCVGLWSHVTLSTTSLQHAALLIWKTENDLHAQEELIPLSTPTLTSESIVIKWHHTSNAAMSDCDLQTSLILTQTTMEASSCRKEVRTDD